MLTALTGTALGLAPVATSVPSAGADGGEPAKRSLDETSFVDPTARLIPRFSRRRRPPVLPAPVAKSGVRMGMSSPKDQWDSRLAQTGGIDSQRRPDLNPRPAACSSCPDGLQQPRLIGSCRVGAGARCPFFRQNRCVARRKTTVYIDESLLRAAKVAAARAGKHEYEVFEEALRKHLGFAGAVERIWAGISPQEAPTEHEAAQIAAEELKAARTARSTHQVG